MTEMRVQVEFESRRQHFEGEEGEEALAERKKRGTRY
jgi:hypothetical protein